MSGMPKILVVDDSPEITRLLQSVLTQAGYRVMVSNDPEAAPELIRQEEPDLITLDICMPGLDGWELCRMIRREHQIPVLVLTVLGNARDAERSLQAGADAYMAKPFPIPEFLKQVQDLLRKKNRRLDREG